MRLIRDIINFFFRIIRWFITLDYRNLFRDGKRWSKQMRKKTVKESKIAREKLKDLPGTNYHLGISHFYRGNLADAVMRFKMVLMMDKHVAAAHYYLSRCYLAKKNLPKAQKHLDQVVKLGEHFPLTGYMRQQLKNKGHVRKRLDPAVMRDHAEAYRFFEDDEHQLERLEEFAKETIEALAEHLPQKETLRVLDVIGQNGDFIRYLKRKKRSDMHVTAVNISEVVAGELGKKRLGTKPLYDRIVIANPLETFDHVKTRFDVMFIGDLLNCAEDPDACLENFAQYLNAGGVIVTYTYLALKEKDEGYDPSKEYFIFHKSTLDMLFEQCSFDLQHHSNKRSLKNYPTDFGIYSS